MGRTGEGVSVAPASGVVGLEPVGLGVSSRVATGETVRLAVRAGVADKVGLAAGPDVELSHVGVAEGGCARRVAKTAVHSGGKVGKGWARLTVGSVGGIRVGVAGGT